MPDPAVIALFEHRLVQLGCPAAQLRSSVHELAEHHDDLKHAALEEGLSESDAEARADELLGEPDNLAAQICAVLRQSSWWGRHPFIAFCLLPFLGMLLMAILGLSLDLLVGQFYLTGDDLHVLADDNVEFALIKMGVLGTWSLMILLTTMLFCWLAWRSACGLKWSLITCAVCSIYSGCVRFQFYPHAFSLGCGFPPVPFNSTNWLPFLVPLPVAAVVWWRRRQSLQRIPVPDHAAGRISAARKQLVLPRTGLLTPSSVIATVAVAAIVTIGFWWRAFELKREARQQERITKIWPAERASVLKQLKTRQMTSHILNATTIHLKPWLNATLADSLDGPAITNRNNLSELPRGIHIFGGVPFDIEGRLQLMGRKLLDTTTVFPVRARNIEIARKCNRIHLLHGASGITPEMTGTNIARLVVHYADGSQTGIPIVAGGHVLDWWGPIYKTTVGKKARDLSAPGSELAWAGGNPCLKEQESESSLRLYKSTFDNPRPGVEIASIDYASAVTDAAPFLVGLTVE